MEASVKYEKPRILLVDMDDKSVDTLKSAGFNVSTGSFGIPISVPRSGKSFPVSLKTVRLPQLEEQEIVIVNTKCPKASDKPDFETIGERVEALWQSASGGEIDPRPFAMATFRDECERVLNHGGIFVVMVSDRYLINYVLGEIAYGNVNPTRPIQSTNWSFLSDLDAFKVVSRNGSEMIYSEHLLGRGGKGASYSCAFVPRYGSDAERWTTLAKNKFGEPVAGIFAGVEGKGTILMLPQMPEISTIVVEIIEQWCTQWAPKFFPHHEGLRWLNYPNYEIPAVVAQIQKIAQIEEAAAAKIAALSSQITEIRANHPHWYSLLNGTGKPLVDAVIHAFRTIGFVQVVDVDAATNDQSESRNLREDIQILDNRPVLIIDVKGITGCPTDADAGQSEKHALMRAREFNGEVKAVTIVNHQRNLPPLDRDPNVFRAEIIGNAEQTGLALMTAWDLFRICRNMEVLNWPPSVVMPIFYRKGRIEPIPEHYIMLGQIVKAWKDSLGLIPNKELTLGARLAIEGEVLFQEITVASLQIEGQNTNSAPAGSNCGISCNGASTRFKRGMRVFLVSDIGSS